ncbi:MAG: hypothetical protein ACEQSK_00310 [Sphingomonadaceae bacterium]
MDQEIAKFYASKVDLLELRESIAIHFGKVHVDIAEVNGRICMVGTRLAELETRLVKWFVATAIAIATLNAGLMFGMLKLLR